MPRQVQFCTSFVIDREDKMRHGISFKRDPAETGLRSIGTPYPNVTIKWESKPFGVIYAPNWMTASGKWSISFKVSKIPTPESTGTWKWVRFLKVFDTEQDARKFAVKVFTDAFIQEKEVWLDEG